MEKNNKKNYNFKIKTDEKNVLKKKSFTLQLEEKISLYDMFEEAINYLYYNYVDHFDISYGDEHFDFEIIRGKRKAICWLEHEHCNCCGGVTDIGGEYADE